MLPNSVPKSKNGQGGGLIISLEFNPNNRIEAKALRMSQRLANAGHGKRKSVLIATLAALEDYAEIFKVDMTTEEMSAMLLRRMITGQSFDGGSSVQIATQDDTLLIETDTKGISAEDIAAQFLDDGQDW